MLRASALILLGLCTACTGATDPTDAVDSDVEELRYTPDPDADSYVPDGYRPEAPTRVVFMGDSITAGAGASAELNTYTSLLVEDRSSAWTDWAVQDLESLYGSLEVVDVSVPGHRTTTLLRDQIPALEEELGAQVSGQTIVVITIGGNDMQAAMIPMLLASDKDAEYDEQIAPVIVNFGKILDFFEDEARFPDGTRVYFTNVYEPTDGAGQASGCFQSVDIGSVLPYLVRANTELRALAEARGFALVDLHGHFQGHGHNHDDDTLETHDAEDPSLWLADDCIHPNDRGHHELRRLFYTAIDGRPLEAPGEAP